jgi:hypothetical protein
VRISGHPHNPVVQFLAKAVLRAGCGELVFYGARCALARHLADISRILQQAGCGLIRTAPLCWPLLVLLGVGLGAGLRPRLAGGGLGFARAPLGWY